jgi:glycosyltransferase involved in cell wall biosynthesis
MKEKKVCFINTSKIWGGGENWQYETILDIKDIVNIVLITNPKGKLCHLVNDEGIETIHLSAGNLSFLNPFKLYKAYRILSRLNLKAVLFNTSNDYKLFTLPAKWAGVKNIIYRRDNGKPLRGHLLNKLLLRNGITHFLPCSQYIGKSALSKNPNLFPIGKIDTIYNSINIEKWDSIQAPPIEINKNDNEIIFGCIGRLSSEKGQLFLPVIANQLKEKTTNFKILVAGNGPLKEEFIDLINKLNVGEWVKPLGFVESNKSFLNTIDCLIIPSYWEGLSTVAIEAMALNKPVIAFNVASNAEVINHGINGFLSEPFKTDEIAEQMNYFIKNPAELKNMGNKGRAIAEQTFSKKVTNKQLLKYFE